MENTKDMFTEFYLECVGAEIAEVFVGNQEIEKIDNLDAYYNWSCDACGGDSYTGCLMSDPDNCVRG